MPEINTWPGWENVRVIGEGSYGKVYEIQKHEYGKTYTAALKVIRIPKNQAEVQSAYSDGMDRESVTTYFSSIVEGITKEFELMSDLKGYTNIVSYQDHTVVKHENELRWDILIRMELLTSLKLYSMDHTLTEKEIIKLGCDICRALDLCWDMKIIHRDIKPENIFVNRRGDFELGDFGVARTVESELTQGSLAGTYTYMAPEVYLGEKYGHTADIYSIAVVLYRFLNNNRMPFLPMGNLLAGDWEVAKERRMKGERIPAPAQGSEELGQAVLKALEYDPKKRYQTAAEFRMALKFCYGHIGQKKRQNVSEGSEQAVGDGFDTDGFNVEQDLNGDEAGEKSYTKKVKLDDGQHQADRDLEDGFSDISVDTADSKIDDPTGTTRVKPEVIDPDPVQKPKKRRAGLYVAGGVGVAALVAAMIAISLFHKEVTRLPVIDLTETDESHSMADQDKNTVVRDSENDSDGTIELSDDDEVIAYAITSSILVGDTVPSILEAGNWRLSAGSDIKWKSSDKSVATVNEDGLITGTAPGTAVISALFQNRTAKFKVQVVAIDGSSHAAVKADYQNISLNPGRSSIVNLALSGNVPEHFSLTAYSSVRSLTLEWGEQNGHNVSLVIKNKGYGQLDETDAVITVLVYGMDDPDRIVAADRIHVNIAE